MSEESARGFQCINCKKWVPVNKQMGTLNRNHCPSCLWSRHVDLTRAGDRLSSCETGMKPVAVTFKSVGIDKYGSEQIGEVMIVHICPKCQKVSINRIASDDNSSEIFKIFGDSLSIDKNTKFKLKTMGITIAEEKDREELRNQILGKKI